MNSYNLFSYVFYLFPHAWKVFLQVSVLFHFCIIVLLVLNPSSIKSCLCKDSRDPGFSSEMMWIICWIFRFLTLCFRYTFWTQFSWWFGGTLKLTCNCKQLPVLSHLCTGSQVICRRTSLVYRFEATAHHLVPALLKQVPRLQRTSLCLGFRNLSGRILPQTYAFPIRMQSRVPTLVSPRQTLSQASSLTILVLVSLLAVVVGHTHSVHPTLLSTLPLAPTPEPCT